MDFPVSLQDKEVSYGAHAPRILALDDYFLMEVEKSEQDPDTGKKIKKKVSKCLCINCWTKLEQTVYGHTGTF